MSDVELRDCTDPNTRGPHVDQAVMALAGGGLAVIPTDTVYGVAADAFTPAAVSALLRAKGRGRQMPPPVLIGDVRTLDGLATQVPDVVRDLVARFWPGPLTVILTAQPSLHWDLGDTRGTVALRMPDDEIALALLRRTGPLAVSSANTTGMPAALTAADAAEMLGRRVRVYLDGGPARGAVASTIVDATGERLRIVREGALSREELGEVAPELLEDASEPAPEEIAGPGEPAPEGIAGPSEPAPEEIAEPGEPDPEEIAAVGEDEGDAHAEPTPAVGEGDEESTRAAGDGPGVAGP